MLTCRGKDVARGTQRQPPIPLLWMGGCSGFEGGGGKVRNVSLSERRSQSRLDYAERQKRR